MASARMRAVVCALPPKPDDVPMTCGQCGVSVFPAVQILKTYGEVVAAAKPTGGAPVGEGMQR